MRMLAVFLWIFIGLVSGNLELGSLAMQDLAVKEAVTRSLNADSRKTNNPIQSPIQMKDVRSETVVDIHYRPKDARSSEMESVGSSLPVAMPSPSGVNKTRVVMPSLGTISTDHQIWLKPVARRDAIISQDFAVTNNTEQRFSEKSKESMRMKRSADNEINEIVLRRLGKNARAHRKAKKSMAAVRSRAQEYARAEEEMERRVRALGAAGTQKVEEAKTAEVTQRAEAAQTAEGTRKAVGIQNTEGTQHAAGIQNTEGTQHAAGIQNTEGTQNAAGIQNTEGTQHAAGIQHTEGTQKPEGTQEPEETQKPEETQEPEESQKVEETQQAEETQEANETQKPEGAQKTKADDDPMSENESYNVFSDKLFKLPTLLQDRILLTDGEERRLLSSYVKSDSKSTEHLAKYKKAKEMERKSLKELKDKVYTGASTTDLVAEYKAVRKGTTWNFVKLQERFKAFFKKPSDALTEFEKMQRDDFGSLDSFLAGSDRTKSRHTKKKAPHTKKSKKTGAKEAKVDDDPMSVTESCRVYSSKISELPRVLRAKIEYTDSADDVLVSSYAEFNGAPPDFLATYNTAKEEERKTLKKLKDKSSSAAAADLVAKYKAVRKGTAWNCVRLLERYKTFFEKPSPALVEYEKVKRDEFDSLDSFLAGSSQTKNQAPYKRRSMSAKERNARAHRHVRAIEAVRSRDQEYARTEEKMKQTMRTQEAEVSEIKLTASTEKTSDVYSTLDDTNRSTDVYRSPDIVSFTDITTSEMTKAKDNKIQFGIAILLEVAIPFAAVILIIVGTQRRKIAECCRRTKKENVIAVSEEKEHVYPDFWENIRRNLKRRQEEPLLQSIMSA